jgi:hypothetical protein
MPDGSSQKRARYRLGALGWLQFERLVSLVLAAEAGLHDPDWRDRAHRRRTAGVDGPVVLPGIGVRLPGPVAVAVVWVPAYSDRTSCWSSRTSTRRRLRRRCARSRSE